MSAELRRSIALYGGLVSLSEIARRLGASKSTVHNWTKWAGFPAPVYEGGKEKLWLWAEVEAWRARR